MKNSSAFVFILLLSFLLLTTGCGENKQPTDDFITVDVTKNYPKKELILQDFMDVEYIPLETNDEFVCQGGIQAVGKNHIIVINHNGDGNIYIFDREGKALRKINRKGQGGEEYTDILRIVLDEDKDEMFVNDMYAKRILVYDLEGNFKRKLPHKDDFLFFEMYNFDSDNLICRDAQNENNSLVFYPGQSFIIISKQDGSIIKEIQIPFEKKETIVMRTKDEASGMTYAYMPSTVHPIVPYFDNYVLVEISADTIYSYSQDKTMKPFIVRTPSVQSLEPKLFLFLSILTDRYYFMETVTKEKGFPATDLVYDKQKKALFRYTVRNGDYSNNEEVFMKSIPLNSEIPSRMMLEAFQLVHAYKRGALKGRLKEIAATLDEESNPVIMLMKHKK